MMNANLPAERHRLHRQALPEGFTIDGPDRPIVNDHAKALSNTERRQLRTIGLYLRGIRNVPAEGHRLQGIVPVEGITLDGSHIAVNHGHVCIMERIKVWCRSQLDWTPYWTSSSFSYPSKVTVFKESQLLNAFPIVLTALRRNSNIRILIIVIRRNDQPS